MSDYVRISLTDNKTGAFAYPETSIEQVKIGNNTLEDITNVVNLTALKKQHYANLMTAIAAFNSDLKIVALKKFGLILTFATNSNYNLWESWKFIDNNLSNFNNVNKWQQDGLSQNSGSSNTILIKSLLGNINLTCNFSCYGKINHPYRPKDLPEEINENCFGYNTISVDGTIYQYIIGYTSGIKFERSNVNGVWGDWIKPVGLSRNLQNGGYNINVGNYYINVPTQYDFNIIYNTVIGEEKQITFAVTNGRYINNLGLVISDENYSISSEIELKSGWLLTMKALGNQDITSMISLVNDNDTYTPLVIANRSVTHNYTYYCENDCTIILSFYSIYGCYATHKNNVLYQRISTLEGYFTDGAANSAIKLDTSVYLWGNEFNGTQSLDGHIESIGDIHTTKRIYGEGGVSAGGIGDLFESGGAGFTGVVEEKTGNSNVVTGGHKNDGDIVFEMALEVYSKDDTNDLLDTKVDKITGYGLSQNNLTDELIQSINNVITDVYTKTYIDNNFVPYEGASKDVNLGDYSLSLFNLNANNNIHADGGVSAGGIGDLAETTSIIDLYRSWDDLYPTNKALEATLGVELYNSLTDLSSSTHTHSNKVIIDGITSVNLDHWNDSYTHSQITNGTNPHATTFANIASKPTTISGYGITDAASKTYIDNNFVPYVGALNDVNLGEYSLSLFNLNASNNIHADGGVSAGGIGDLSETTSIIDLYRSWDDLYPTNKALEATLGVELYNSLTDLSSVAHTHSNKDVLDSTTAAFLHEEKIKLAGIEANANKYILPYATSAVLGGVTVGSNIDINDGVISVKDASTLNKGVVQLSDSIGSSSSLIAATSKAVKAAWDLADSKWLWNENTIKGVVVNRSLTADKLTAQISLWGQLFDGSSDINGDLHSTGNISADGGVSAGGIGDLSEAITSGYNDILPHPDNTGNAVTSITSNGGSTLYYRMEKSFSEVGHNHDTVYSLLCHTHDDRYYTETEIGSILGGSTSITGYNKSNWDTAFGWGNHQDAGYAAATALSSHTGNSTIHITSNERTNWNDAYSWGDHASVGYLLSSTAASTYVPYTGASADVNIGNHNLSLLGNVGIGTVSPTEKLHVVGNSLFTGTVCGLGGVFSGGIGDLSEVGGSGYNDILPYPNESGNAVTFISDNGGSTLYYHLGSFSLSDHNHNSLYQPLDSDLTAIAGLTGTSGFLKKTSANTWSLDTNVYLTGITKAQVEDVLTGAITSHTHNYQAPLTGTGFVKSAAGVISYDTNIYLTAHQTIYGLTIQKNGTTIATYTPNSAAKTINISDVASASTLDSHISNISNPHSVTKTQVGLGNVEDTKLSTWAGTDSITTLGTISSGTWNATKIGVSKGGTGKTSIAIDRMLYASSANTYEEVITTSFGRGILSAISETEVAGLRAATATKLASSVYLWGNLFDGSYSINGGIESIGNIHTTQRIYGDAGVYAGGIGDLAESNSGGYNNVEYNDVQGVIVDYVSNVVSNTSSLKVYRNKLKTNLSQYIDDLGVNPVHTHSQYLLAALKGTANGLAELDSNGLVPASQLPSYVDDVLTYTSLSAFPATGIDGKIYIASDTNLTYRWSGTAYVEISKSLALGETASTAYRGDRGKAAYDHSQASHTFSIAGQDINALGGSIIKASLLSALNVAEGAQVNVLEGIKLNGTALTPDSKVVNVNACTSISVPTGLSVAALTTGGLIAISLTNGYAIPTSANISQIVANTTNINTLQGYFIDGSAKSAIKLLNARTLWGRSFDGTANVSGNMTDVGSIESTGNIHTTQRVYGDSGVFSGGIGDLAESGSSGYNRILLQGTGNAVTSISDNGGSTLFYNRDKTFSEASDVANSLDTKVDKVTGYGLSKNDLSDTLLSALNANTTARHSHSNKAVLDATTASFLTADKTKLTGIATNANNYSLPTASSNVLGGIKVGTRLTIASGVLSADVQSDNNFTSAYKTKLDEIAAGANLYTHPTYTARTSGLYKITVNTLGHVTATAAVAKSDITGLGIPAQDTVYTHPTSGVTAGTYRSVTVNANGHVTAGTNPTTLADYKITDGVTTNTTQTITGAKTFSANLTASTFTSTVLSGFMFTGAKTTIYNGFGAPAGGGFSFCTNGDVLTSPTLSISASNNVGVNTVNPIYSLDVNGTGRFTGNVTAPTFIGALTGNASTATKLAATKTINGTAFDGSADITTTKWGTERTLTIGSKGYSVDGSAAVTWTLADIGAAAVNQTMYIGTTAVAINRASGAIVLTGITSIDGNAATANKVNHTLTRGTYLTGNNFNGSANTTWSVDATSANTPNKVVVRDANGDFAAGNINGQRIYGDEGVYAGGIGDLGEVGGSGYNKILLQGSGNAVTSISDNGGSTLFYNRDKTFSESGHTHTKSQITDFPTTWAWASLTGKPSTFAPSAHTLDSHSNVTITSNASGEILKWNGSAWINNTLAEAGIAAATHTHTKSQITDFTHTHLWADLTNKPTTFTPSSHTHGNITNGGYIGSTANLPIITGTGGILQVGSFGTTANTFCQGNDSRLSNARIASDVYAWAKASTKPSYTTSEVSEGTNLYFTDARAGASITKARVEGVLTGAITSHTHNYQAPLTGTGFVKSTAGVISYDTNTYLTTHQTIYGLTIQKNGTKIDIYTPNSAAKTINISDVASASTLSSHVGNSTIHITSNERTNWNDAYSWGDHQDAGYAAYSDLATHTGNSNIHITATERTNWNKAYGWGDHNSAGYAAATTLSSHVGNSDIHVNSVEKTHWNTAYNFANEFNTNHPDLASIEALTGTSGLLRKTAANTWSLDTAAYITGINKAMVEEKLTGNITSHTHSQYLTAHQTIYSLIIQKNGTTIDTFVPNSAAKTINISDVASAATLASHITNVSNPHSVTKAQVGLGNVENAAASGLYVPLTRTVAGLALSSNIATSSLQSALGLGSAAYRAENYFSFANHTHGNVTNAGYIGSTANLPIITGTGGILQVGSFGTTANTFCQGNDSRLSNARIASDVYAWAKASAKPSYTYTEVGAAADSHTHTYLTVSDTRAVVSVPQDLQARALQVDFKNNTSVGNPTTTANVTYSHIISFAGWNVNEPSGGWPSQLSIGDGIAVRQATSATTWGVWRNLYHTGNLNKSTLGLGNVDNTADASKNVLSATKLYTGRTLKVNLASTSASTSFNGTANVSDIGVSGILPVSNGGTGNNTFVSNKLIYAQSATKLSSMSTTVGSTSVPIYLNEGALTACTSSQLFSGLSWSNGTTSGPTLNITVTGQSRTSVIPSASASYSGVVTTGTQTFAGQKTFNSTVSILDALSVANNINAGGIIQGVGGVFAGGIADLGGSEYAIPTASVTSIGGIKTGYTTYGKNYKVQLDASGNAFVNVSWTNTVYSAGNGISIDGTTISNNGVTFINESDVNGCIGVAQAYNGGAWTNIPIHGLGSAAYTNSSAYASSSHNHSGVYEPVISTKNTAFNVNFGTAAGTACVGNDSRLSNARTPLSHTHTKSQITDFPTTWAWGSLTGTPSTFAPSAHTLDSHSNVTITSNSTGEILKWNGSAWINNTLAEAGIAAASHTHTYASTVKLGTVAYAASSNIVSLPAYPTTLPASDVSSWAKASTKPSYTYSEVGAAASVHSHEGDWLYPTLGSSFTNNSTNPVRYRKVGDTLQIEGRFSYAWNNSLATIFTLNNTVWPQTNLRTFYCPFTSGSGNMWICQINKTGIVRICGAYTVTGTVHNTSDGGYTFNISMPISE